MGEQSAFEEQMKIDFTNQITLPMTPDGLPSFSDDCDPEDSAKLDEATTVMNESIATEEFAAYLKDLWEKECMDIEMTAYESQIDAQALTDMEGASVQTLNDWFGI